MDDLIAQAPSCGIRRVHVVDLDRGVGCSEALASCCITLSCAVGLRGAANVKIQPWSMTTFKPST
jgi:hypothetical protein